MILLQEEWGILGDLIGKKVQSIRIPTAADSVSPPVKTVLVLPENRSVMIDSCSRSQRPTETPLKYPQMRIREVDEVPKWPNGQEIELSETGEIVCAIHVENEEIASPQDFACYTKSVRIEFSGGRDVTITRETFRSPSLQIFERENIGKNGKMYTESAEYASIQTVTV